MWSKEQYDAKEAERARKHQESAQKRWYWLGQSDPVARFTAYLAAFTSILAGVSVAQWCVLHGQQVIMQGQLDVMQDDKRPWLKAEIHLNGPIRFSDWAGSKGISVPLSFTLKNYGNSPAINVRTNPRITLHPGNPKRFELAIPQTEACDQVRSQSLENDIGGSVIFPNEETSEELNPGIFGIYKTDVPTLFSVLGCVDYTYAGGRHGQTGFRMMLGRVANGKVVGLPFVTGEREPYDYAPPPELLANGYPSQSPSIGLLKPEDVYFKPEDSGNYAK